MKKKLIIKIFLFLFLLIHSFNLDASLKKKLNKRKDSKVGQKVVKKRVVIKSWVGETPSIFELEKLKFEVENGENFDHGIEAAKISMQSDDKNIRDFAIKLFESLFEKNQGFNEAMEAANSCIPGKTLWISQSSKELLKILLDKLKFMLGEGQGFDQILDMAKTCKQCGFEGIRYFGLKLFAALVMHKKGFNFDEVLEGARTGVQSEDLNTVDSALELFETLVRQELVFDYYAEVLEVSKKGMQNKFPFIKYSSIKLFKALVEDKKAYKNTIKYDDVIEAVNIDIQSNDKDFRSLLIKLVKTLVKKGLEFDEAITIGKECAYGHYNLDKHEVISLKLFIALVKKYYGYQEAIEVAKLFLENDDKEIRYFLIKLFKALLEKEEGLKEILSFAQEYYWEYGDRGSEDLALKLFKALVKAGYAFDDALTVANDVMRNRQGGFDFYFPLKIFKALVNNGFGFNDALEAAQLGMQDNDPVVVSLALDVFRVLVTKDQFIEEALAAAAQNRIFDEDYEVISVFRLFDVLGKKGFGFNESLLVVRRIMMSNNEDFNKIAISFLRALFSDVESIANSGQDFKKLMDLVLTGISFEDTQELSLNLFDILFRDAFKVVLEVTMNNMHSENVIIKTSAEKLFNKIKEKILLDGNLLSFEFINNLEKFIEDDLYFSEIRDICNTIISNERLNLDEELKKTVDSLLERLNSCSYCYDSVGDIIIECKEGHLSCVNCLVQDFIRSLGEGKLPKFICANECITSEEDLDKAAEVLIEQNILSDLDYARLVSLREIVALKKRFPDKFFECPFCYGGAVVENPSKNKTMTCITCGKASCIDCKKEPHEGTCLESKYKKIRNIDEFFLKAMNEFYIRRCANCNQVFIKTEACNSVGCSRCGYYTCYHCGENLGNDHDNAYEHFGRSIGRCPLYAPGKKDIERSEYYYNKAKEEAKMSTIEWFYFRFRNELPVDGIDFERNNLEDFIDSQIKRLDEENQFNN